MLKGFRDFILRGNVVDLAVAVIIGAAFTAIVSSLVMDLLNPLIAATVGKPDFSGIVFYIHGGKLEVGDFFNALFSFLIDAAAIYFGVVLPFDAMLKRFKKHPPVEPTTKVCPECLSEIPIAATRCAHCAQPLPAPNAPPANNPPAASGPAANAQA